MSTPTSSRLPTLPDTKVAFRFGPRSLARFVGESSNKALNSAGVMPNRFRAN
jgi:hypothetical protein